MQGGRAPRRLAIRPAVSGRGGERSPRRVALSDASSTWARSSIAINATHPDLVCLLGDFVTVDVIGGRRVRRSAIAEELGRLRAPDGVAAVLGNHDHSFGRARCRRRSASAGSGCSKTRPSAFNTRRSGLDRGRERPLDRSARHSGALYARSPTPGHRSYSSHTIPTSSPMSPASVMLTLAGHTHGGQVGFPYRSTDRALALWPAICGGSRRRARPAPLRHRRASAPAEFPVRFGVPPTIFVLTSRDHRVTADFLPTPSRCCRIQSANWSQEAARNRRVASSNQPALGIESLVRPPDQNLRTEHRGSIGQHERLPKLGLTACGSRDGRWRHPSGPWAFPRARFHGAAGKASRWRSSARRARRDCTPA